MSKENRIHRVVFEDNYCGVKYWIVENGYYTDDGSYDMRWYCAYVKPPLTKKIKYKDKLDDLEVHGGITFDGDLSIIKGCRYVWGWDYNHAYDCLEETLFKTKFQMMEQNEVIDIIQNDCQEFIRRYLI